VLEHVDEPAELLAGALARGTHVIAEVPLEATPLGRLRMRVKEVATRRDRLDNVSGHVQFFSQRTFDELVAAAGGEILRRRLYVPRDALRHAAERGGAARRVYARAVSAAASVAGDAVWGRLYHGHYAVLLRRSTP
jgi:hypothetical protein